MPLVLDAAAFQKKCAGLSMVRHQVGVNVLTSGSKTERLLSSGAARSRSSKMECRLPKSRLPARCSANWPSS